MLDGFVISPVIGQYAAHVEMRNTIVGTVLDCFCELLVRLFQPILLLIFDPRLLRAST